MTADATHLLRVAMERDGDGLGITVDRATGTQWASATFTGARHDLEIVAPATDAVAAWLAGLPEHDFGLRRHLVADLRLVRTQQKDGALRATIEVLTVEAD